MEASLRSLGLSVPQYSCLEILNARPGISNADLARGVFVTRQAMHQLLGGLQEAGLVSAGGQGRVQRYSLTPKDNESSRPHQRPSQRWRNKCCLACGHPSDSGCITIWRGAPQLSVGTDYEPRTSVAHGSTEQLIASKS